MIARALSLTVFAWVMMGISVVAGSTVSVRASGLTASLVQSRTSGVAPLAVFFDASATSDISTTDTPFHDLDYSWDFGDAAGSPVSGTTWAYGARAGVASRNKANGPVSAHIYENVGTYITTLTIYDGTSVVSQTSAPIVVSDPNTVFSGTHTICISSSIKPTAGADECPPGAKTAQQSNFVSLMSSYANTGQRILLKRGDIFSSPTQFMLQNNGPGIIGAYGTGAPPSIQTTVSSQSAALFFQSPTSTLLSDWRVMDLDFNGLDGTSGVGIKTGGNGFDFVTILRVSMHNIMRGIEGGPYGLINLMNGWAVVDNHFIGCTRCAGDWRVYLVGQRLAIMGNYLDNLDTGGSHVIRSEYMRTAVISNNTLTGAGDKGIAHEIKLHSWGWSKKNAAIDPSGTGAYTEKVLITDNHINSNINNWAVALAPQNSSYDERLRDIIVQNNWFTSGSGAGTMVELFVSTVGTTTIRNNIFDLTNAFDHYAIDITQRSVAPPPNDTRIYNNTIYSGSTGNFYGVKIDSMVTNSIIKNNLGSAPLATRPLLVENLGTGTVKSNNLLNTTPASIFVSTTLSAPNDFELKALPNSARDTGLPSVPVFSDFFLTTRPQNGLPDIGAVEGP